MTGLMDPNRELVDLPIAMHLQTVRIKKIKTQTVSTVMTSQPSPITPTTQIGNITVSDLATKMGSQMEDVVAAINEVQEAQTPTEDLESQVIEPQ